MSDLVESILENDLVLSQKILEERISDIVEKKLYEKKRMMQAESFGMLKFTKAEIEAKKKAGYRKASDVLGDPAKIQLSAATKKYRKSVKKKEVSEEQIDEAGLAPTKIGKLARPILKFAGKLSQAKKVLSQYKQQKAADKHNQETDAERQSADLRKSHGVERPEDKKTPGFIRRNVNTLIGREPGYTPTPTDDTQKGGRIGKVVRKTGKAVGRGIGAALSDIGSQYGS